MVGTSTYFCWAWNWRDAWRAPNDFWYNVRFFYQIISCFLLWKRRIWHRIKSHSYDHFSVHPLNNLHNKDKSPNKTYKTKYLNGLLWLNFHFVVVGLSSWWTSCSIWSFVQVWSEFLPCSYRRSQGEDPECKYNVTLYLTASEVSRQSTSARTIHLVINPAGGRTVS